MSSSMPIVTENVAIVSDQVVTKVVTKSLPLKYKTAMYAVLGFIKNLADNGEVDPSVFPLAVAKLPLFLEVSEQMKSLDEMFDLKHIEKTIVKPLVAMEKKKNTPPKEKKARVPKEKAEKKEKVPKEKKEKIPKEKKEKVEKKKKGKEETSDNEVEVVIANSLPEWPEEQKVVEKKEVEKVEVEEKEVEEKLEEKEVAVEEEVVEEEVVEEEVVEEEKVEDEKVVEHVVEEETSASESEKKKKDPKKKKNPEDKEKRGRKPKEIQMESVFMEKEQEKVELNTESYIQVTTGDGKKIKVAKRKV
jgi:hypothetical protein